MVMMQADTVEIRGKAGEGSRVILDIPDREVQ
jgi:hypothetical protein